jgi:hypothetical protein
MIISIDLFIGVFVCLINVDVEDPKEKPEAMAGS